MSMLGVAPTPPPCLLRPTPEASAGPGGPGSYKGQGYFAAFHQMMCQALCKEFYICLQISLHLTGSSPQSCDLHITLTKTNMIHPLWTRNCSKHFK